MKNTVVKIIAVLCAVTLLFGTGVSNAYASESAQTSGAYTLNAAKKSTAKAKKTKKKKGKTGWKYTKSGKRSYYVNGKQLKNRVYVIKKYKYYFNKKGYVVEGKNVEFRGKTYYLSNKGHVRAISKKNKYYFPNGKRMSKAEAEDWKARMYAEEIAEEITNSKMTKKEKLRTCFDWVMAKYYKTYRKFKPTDYWYATYAIDHFTTDGGDCHSDAGAFAYLAVAIGYKNVYVCNDSDGITAQGHAWTEINGKVYDPLFAQATSFKDNYGVPYGTTYVLHPILHINMDYNEKRPKK